MSESKPIFIVLMAGGRGTRLWPLSRESYPKQFLSFNEDGKTLLQEAARRAAEILGGLEMVYVVTHVEQAALMLKQLPELPVENLILEPASRNTAAGIGLAALHIQRRVSKSAHSNEAVMVVFPADHLYRDELPWLGAVRTAIAFADANDRLVAIGIPSAFPSSSYGYLHLGRILAQPDEAKYSRPVYEVQEFIEKPDLARAMDFYESGNYLWNIGTFAWRISVFQNALKRHLPSLYEGLMAVRNDLEDTERLARFYSGLENISIDYGIMEKAGDVAVVSGDFQRIDVGNLVSLAEVWSSDPDGNAGMGERLFRDSRNNLFFTDEGLVSLIGVEDLVVIRRGEIVLVCPKDRVAEVKELVNDLKQKGMLEFL